MLSRVNDVAFALFETPLGTCAAAWTAQGLVRVMLPEADERATRDRVRRLLPGAIESRPRGAAREAIMAMRAHLGGALDPLAHLALDDEGLPPFHRRVYAALRQVPPGETIGYGELASRAGAPAAARAVGQAVGRNPFPIVVPCHRVLAAGGKPGGFSAHGGVGTKQRMLAVEGVTLARPGRKAGFACDLDAALAHLTEVDPRLAGVIRRADRPTFRLRGTESTFEALAESIVYQQLNGKAAATIHGRVRDLFPRRRVTPEGVLRQPEAALRGAGLSQGKMLALRDLAQKTLDGVVPDVKSLHTMSDAAVVRRLVQVRGIGPWTVHMLLMFRLGRPDVLPVDDFGVRHGFRLTYGKKAMPTPKELARAGEKWKPYRAVASWYMWRAVDLARGDKGGGRA